MTRKTMLGARILPVKRHAAPVAKPKLIVPVSKKPEEKSQEAVADGKLFVPDEAAKKAMREALDQAGPKEYAAGGQITADDLIIEERKL
jgi:hypothetical protein